MIVEEVEVVGCKVSNLSLQELLLSIKELALSPKQEPAVMLSANVHGLNYTNKLPWLKKLNKNAELVRNDSAGILLAGKILGIPIKDRMTWADFGWSLASFCEQENLSLFFLGNRPGIAERAKKRLQSKYGNLKVLGTHHGYFDKEGEENEKIIQKINKLKPDILIVGFGMPLQERWIYDNKSKLEVGVVMTGGNCFTFLAGAESRAPRWMYRNGLEWFYRFVKEPKRLFGRYVIGNPVFLMRVLNQKFSKS